MTKLINFIFMVLSLIVIAALVYTINDTLSSFSSILGESITFSDVAATLSNNSLADSSSLIAILGSTLFILFGFPVTIFLITINGLKD